jgi:Spy/CpxP family protein refolding chaperone
MQKMGSIKVRKSALTAVFVLTIAGLTASQFVPAWADKTMARALVDPDLEIALSNHFKKRFFNLIDATDEQQNKLSGIMTKQLEDARPLRAQIREELLDLSDLIADESSTNDVIKNKVKEIKELREQIQDKRLDSILRARAVLTADQKRIVSQRMKGILTGNPRMGR